MYMYQVSSLDLKVVEVTAQTNLEEGRTPEENGEYNMSPLEEET